MTSQNLVTMSDMSFSKKVVAIVKFGPATPTSGMRPAEYFQVTIDPSYCSPSGEYIRFGKNDGDEIVGWQRVDALTVCEVIAEWIGDAKPDITKTEGAVTMRAVEQDHG